MFRSNSPFCFAYVKSKIKMRAASFNPAGNFESDQKLACVNIDWSDVKADSHQMYSSDSLYL